MDDASIHGLRISEIPVDWIDDPDSRVKVIRTSIDDLKGMGRVAMTFWRGGDRVEDVAIARPPIPPGSGGELISFATVGVASTVAYLVLLFGDGRQVALADVGFAFAPDTVHTGPLPDLPPTFCFADFRHLSQGIEALLAQGGREKEALGAMLACIALLDGARAAGLDVAREERRLDGLLRELEARGLKV